MRRPPNSVSPRPLADRTGLALVVTLLGTTGLATDGAACGFAPPPDDSAAVSIELGPGTSQDFSVEVFEQRDEDGNVLERECYAAVAMPLSAFPSISNRLDTAAVARAIQESAAALGVDGCQITVYYDDPQEALGMSERCVQGTYGFSSTDFWSTKGETRCWSEEDVAAWEEMERIAEEEADAYAARQEALEREQEWGESLDVELVLGAVEDVAGQTLP